jgi:hypothetical protein
VHYGLGKLIGVRCRLSLIHSVCLSEVLLNMLNLVEMVPLELLEVTVFREDNLLAPQTHPEWVSG